jgi:hypothetical protein
MLAFDEATHTYTWNGVIVPSVTQILKPLTDYGMIPADKLEVARMKGVAVHKMVELHAKGDLDEETLPEWMRPVLISWEKFVADTGFEIIYAETQVYNPAYGYAGTFDLYGRMRDGLALIDVKRSFLAGPVIGLQLAGYHAAMVDSLKNIGVKFGPVNRYALKLNETGPYRLEPFTDKKDFGDFITALAFHKLKEKHR